MAEEAQAVDGAAQAAADSDGSTPMVDQASSGGEETISLEEARKLRREAQGLRKRLAEFEAVDARRKQAELTELDQAKQRLADMEAQLATANTAHQEQIVRYEVMLRATGMNVVDAEVVARLLDWSSLEFDENGAPTNVEKLLRDLLKAKPYLIKPAEQSAAAPNVNARNGNEKVDAKAHEEDLRRRFRLKE